MEAIVKTQEKLCVAAWGLMQQQQQQGMTMQQASQHAAGCKPSTVQTVEAMEDAWWVLILSSRCTSYCCVN